MKETKDQNLELLESLLAKGDKEGIKKQLAEILAQDLTPQEKGAAYIAITSAYIKLANEINKAYLETLNEFNQDLEELRKLARATEDKIKVVKVRESLKKS